MIRLEQVHDLLVAASPTFNTNLLLGDNLYELLGAFGRHLLELYNLDHATSFLNVGVMIENLHIDGDELVKNAATIGLLESLQNIWLNAGIDPMPFREWLLPVSREQWDALYEFWHGENESTLTSLASRVSPFN